MLASSSQMLAQIKGNGIASTKDIPVGAFTAIDMGLTANYEIDLKAKEYLEITIDGNLIEEVDKEVRNGVLHVDQLDWIQPKSKVLVRIGGRNITKITQTSHSKTKVFNIDHEDLSVLANVGDLTLVGRVDHLMVKVGTATVDGSYLEAQKATFRYDSWGTIKALVSGDYDYKNLEDGKLYINNKLVTERKVEEGADIRFIKFTIKNNSANRHQFYVVGPKPDGSRFSYGFPMMPLQKRDKDWTNGTKVYKVNSLGIRKLVKTITLEDEGKTVNLFAK